MIEYRPVSLLIHHTQPSPHAHPMQSKENLFNLQLSHSSLASVCQPRDYRMMAIGLSGVGGRPAAPSDAREGSAEGCAGSVRGGGGDRTQGV
eukprot:scaffold256693_cov30-Prasinocladus_malaysianus.AAC.1